MIQRRVISLTSDPGINVSIVGRKSWFRIGPRLADIEKELFAHLLSMAPSGVSIT
jgi:hypothetical protein